jgi:hypothetical protein
VWRTQTGDYLIEGRVGYFSRDSGVTKSLLHGAQNKVLDSAGASIVPAAFSRVSKTGEPLEIFVQPTAYSIEDEQGLTNIHAVVGDSLYAYHYREIDGREEVKSAVKLTRLVLVEDAQVPIEVLAGASIAPSAR